jgi:hypothetical protein
MRGVAITLGAGLALALVLAPALPRGAAASCGADNCSLDNTGFGVGFRRITFEASFQTLDQDRARIGTRDAAIGEITGEEDEVRMRSHTVLFRGQMAIAPRWTATLTLPYIDRLHSHISHDHAPGVEPPVHTWNYSGIGDLSLLAGFRALGTGDMSSPVTLSVQAGVKVPTGSQHVDAIDGDVPEPHARLGSGSYDGLLGVHATRFASVPMLTGISGTLPIYASAMVTLTGRGTEDYRIGTMMDAAAGATYPLADRVQLLTQLNFRTHARDDAPGDVSSAHTQHVENTGGTALYLTPGLRLKTGSTVSFSGYVQIPLYQRVNGIQLVAPYHLWFGATYRLP